MYFYFAVIGDLPPSVIEINRHVIQPHAPHWKDIGLELDLSYDALVIIETDNPNKCVQCFEATLAKWLKANPHPTWTVLEVAITNARRKYLDLNPVTNIYSES